MKASIKVLSEIKIDGLGQVELLKDTISVPQCVVILGSDRANESTAARLSLEGDNGSSWQSDQQFRSFNT